MTDTLRVVLDTNVLLSGIAYPGSLPGKIISAWRHGAIDVLLSDFILDELRRVLPRLAHRHGLTADEIDELIALLALQAEIVAPLSPSEHELRDRADLPVLGTFLAARQSWGAAYLITGDSDLLALADRLPILTPAAFWSLHGGL